MNVKSYGVVACIVVAFPLLYISGLEITVKPADDLKDSLGQELMSALAVPEGDETLSFSSWSYPTSIVVRTIPYRVDVGWLESGCKVYSTNDVTYPLAEISVTRMSNEKDARLYCLGNIALGCSLMAETLARSLSVEYLDPATNTLFVSWRNQDDHRRSHLISKNIALWIRAHTNALDFAVAILNAGLPEAERIVLPPQE